MKKLLAFLLCMVVTMGMNTGAFAAFSDMPDGIDGEIIQKAVDNGLISGFEDGTVQPATAITRAQMATIMSRAMNAQDTADISSFADVKEGDWYYDAMAKAVAMGAFKGDDKNCLNPNNTISRQEAFIVLSRIFDLPAAKGDALASYSDASTVASWAKEQVSSVAYGGYLGDITAIRPLEAMTRLEFATVMDKIVTTYIDEDGEYTSFPAGNVLIRAQNVVLKGIDTDNNVFIGDGVKGTIDLNDCVFNNIIIRGGKVVFNSGLYTRTRAIGAGTIIDLKVNGEKLVKKFEDGTTGKFYAQPGKGKIILPPVQIEIIE